MIFFFFFSLLLAAYGRPHRAAGGYLACEVETLSHPAAPKLLSVGGGVRDGLCDGDCGVICSGALLYRRRLARRGGYGLLAQPVFRSADCQAISVQADSPGDFRDCVPGDCYSNRAVESSAGKPDDTACGLPCGRRGDDDSVFPVEALSAVHIPRSRPAGNRGAVAGGGD